MLLCFYVRECRAIYKTTFLFAACWYNRYFVIINLLSVSVTVFAFRKKYCSF